ncbi:PAS domain-containing protein [Rhodopseudomonas sp. B29]|uniref:PAS domain-containing protein n=1 Tax=Rhodopseudomonas sp. B29 TaxID=95607 RepID=UPI0003B6689B|nr:PAS domain-containing protein [Rhodopseudomonas sp. B29]
MTKPQSRLPSLDDPRLAVHATSSLPVWLWSTDGSRVLWANPVAARLFGAADAAELAGRSFGPADAHRRLVAQLARRLPAGGATRLERLRGFGARLGTLLTCACSRLAFDDGTEGVLIAAAEPVGRPMPLHERLRALLSGIDTPIAAFARDGLFLGSNDAARALLGFRNLTEAGLDQAREDALRTGRAETPIGLGHVVLQRVGNGADIGLVARLEPAVDRSPVADEAPSEPAAAEPAEHAAEEPAPAPAETSPPDEIPAAAIPDYEAPATLSEAPAEYTLLDDAPAVASEPETKTTEEAGIGAAVEDAIDPEPSPYIEAVADEPAAPPAEQPIAEVADEQPAEAAMPAEEPAATRADDSEPAADIRGASDDVADPPAPREPIAPPEPPPPLEPRRHPLRFVWRMDAEQRFDIASDEFVRLLGPRFASALGQPWAAIRTTFDLDPDDKFAEAIARHHTWSGIVLQWPADGSGERLPVELSGLPVQDRDGNFAGYRGFGVCRDLAALDRLAELRRSGTAEMPPRALSADLTPATHLDNDTTSPSATFAPHQPASETAVDTPPNVLPFRPTPDGRVPSLTPIENNAFNELARQLSARLENDTGLLGDADTHEAAAEPQAALPQAEPEPSAPQAEWLTPPTPPAQGSSTRDRVLLDLMPVGVLIYRLDRLLYANPTFLGRMGYDSLAALEQAGGLDALYVEPVVGGGASSSTSEVGTAITIAATPAYASDQPSDPRPIEAAAGRLFTIDWDGEQALALIFSPDPVAPPHDIAAALEPVAEPEPQAGLVDAEELAAILDTTAEGIVMFDADGAISACNRSAEALFGCGGDELVTRNLTDLFAPESQSAVRDYLASVGRGDADSLLDHGLEALGRVRDGGVFPLTMTIGRTRADGPNFFAVFRDLAPARRIENELAQVRRLADRAAGAKTDVLARLSHEIRTPINAIIGFAEVMIEQRFGALGNERYTDYLRDIRASGERVIGIVNDMLDLSRIETGHIDLSFESQNLNDLVEHCVAAMQPRANRERIIIRSSLAHALPQVVADPTALRQIVTNLIGTSIQLAKSGGQVIVSTAVSDFGEVVLRVRDTGHKLGDDEIAAALQPFRSAAPSDHTDESGVSLSLTKALVEANRAQFHIKSAPQSGTLIEVVFGHAAARV